MLHTNTARSGRARKNRAPKPDAEPPSQSEPVKEIIVQEDPILREITERLEALDPDSLTPREALEALYAMQAALRKTNETKELEE